MKTLYLVLVFMALGHVALAQSYEVSGIITDERTSETMEGVIVSVDSGAFETVTNSAGYFTIRLLEGRHVISFYGLGMTTHNHEIELHADVSLNLSMRELHGNLDEVEVVARKVTNGVTYLEAVEGFTIFEAKKNEIIVLDDFAANKVANNARQVFAKVPGLNIWESDFAGLQLDIAARGLGPSRTANFNTRQNGYDMSADALGYPESYYMPAMQAVERIEVVRGAASLQYGTQFGGMLNFKLREAPHRPLEVVAEQAVGSYGLLNTFVSAGGRKKKWDYYSYYQYREGEGWRDNSGFHSHTAFARVGYQASDRLRLGMEYSFLNYEAQQPGGLTDETFYNGSLERSARSRNWFGVNWNLLAATLDYTFSSSTKLNIRNFGLISSRNALGNLEQIGVPDNPEVNRTIIRDEFANFGSEARVVHESSVLKRPMSSVFGFRYYNGSTDRRQGDGNASSNPDFEFLNPDDPEEFDYEFPSKNFAFFVENLFEISQRTHITAGARYEHIRTDAEGIWKLNRRDFAGNLISTTANYDQQSTTRSFVLFGVGASYDINENLQTYTNISENFRSITFSDLRVVNPNFQLDSAITDENGYNADIGIRGSVRPWMTIDASLFLLRYNDRIGAYELPGSTTLFRTNIGTSRHIGVEFFSEVDIFKLCKKKMSQSRLAVFLNLAVTDAKYTESDITAIKGRDVEYVPNLMLRSGVNYKWNDLKVTFQVSHLGDQYSDATNSSFNPNALTGPIASYTVLDFSADYRFKSLTFSAGLNNLTNTRYFTRRAESYPGPGIIPATPRSFYAAVGVRL